ncbi:MAG: hypothetical protein HZC37_28830 [Burkholderiales bacterium]|nr:hypothetical protein [Burkholderiales bacterium]
MAESIAPEFARFVAEERRAKRLAALPGRLDEGSVGKEILVPARQAAALLQVAARRASGLFRPSTRTEVVWVEGESELAVVFSGIRFASSEGLFTVQIPVRCDRTGDAVVNVFFACGTVAEPTGLYAAALRRPQGPELVIATWGDALVAFAWQCLLGLVSGIAGATGKDARGNVLVPVEMAASRRGLHIVPMARHRFAGSSGLKPVAAKVTKAPKASRASKAPRP